MSADVERQHVEAGGVEELRDGQRPIARRFPAMDEDDGRARGPEPAGMNQRRQREAIRGGTVGLLEREPKVGRV